MRKRRGGLPSRPGPEDRPNTSVAPQVKKIPRSEIKPYGDVEPGNGRYGLKRANRLWRPEGGWLVVFKKPTSSASVIGAAAQWVSLCEVMPTQDGTPPDLFLCLAPASAGTHNEQAGTSIVAVLLGGLCGLPHRCVAMGLDPPVLAPLLCLAMHMGGTWGTGLTYGLWLRHMSPCHGFGVDRPRPQAARRRIRSSDIPASRISCWLPSM